jgi:predicted DNA-binding transcriptional regulator YafY
MGSTQKLAAATNDQNGELMELAGQLMSVLDLKLADHSRHQQMLRTVQWAMLQGKQLKGTYATPYKDKPVKLTLHPYRLCLAGQGWYLIARPHDGESPRTYRVPRFQTLQMLDRPASVPADFDLRSYFGNAWTVFRGATTYQIEIEFSKDAALLVTETNWHHSQQVKAQHKDGRIVLSFEIDGLDEIVWWVLGWSGRAKVLAPAELRERVVEQLQQALTLNSA